MNPQDNQQNLPNTGQPASSAGFSAPQQQATVNIIRGQLDDIYSGRTSTSTPQTTPVAVPTRTQAKQQISPDPVNTTTTEVDSGNIRPHGLKTSPPITISNDDNTQAQTDSPKSTPQISEEQWKQYHSAWQKYYQMYYERYYVNHLPMLTATQSDEPLTSVASINDSSLSQKDAMQELRDKIRSKVNQSTDKVRKSRYLGPIVAGLAVLLIFVFLQYNRAFFGIVAAYTSPGNISPQNIIVDPATEVSVGPEPRMIIPKINVDAPVVYGIGPDHKSQMLAMEKGVAHFAISGANAVPGQIGNAVFAAHSSNDAFASGDYKFVFAQNEKLAKGDIIYMNFEGRRYTYSVTSLEVVMPSEVSRVQINATKPMLTLISCVPLGTAEKRLLVFAEQISPDPSSATTSEEDASTPQSSTIPGSPSPTLLERIFGGNN